ncbi:recombination protein RecR [Pokkaliibacter plantistimulans]|uniref:Recombination protein RecR n=2 Tax=Pseudomonadota TaxID=1224 RepID=A0ABX5LS52_9GAMM|nr:MULTISPECIES: recombination mediator RecR [Pokkaliibacter]MDH2435018.1 recombination mediator RecR [Pokkaliibacter sp. MBI-7]PPC76058.1 recombination protein RecR [Pokkaliibacter plantistimulans]PXF29486.1 recombination protein RecR [Pokkaliibacter plantistimulans]
MHFSPLIDQLMDSLRCLPGVGPKTAQRMALHLLERDRVGAERLAQAMLKAVELVGHCEKCRNLSESPICRLCESSHRDESLLCVVEMPADVLAIEQTGSYRGHYFVLMGHLSPIEGIGPEQLGIAQLLSRVRNSAVEEIIIATNPTVEGEATAHYIVEQMRALPVKVSRIAHGVPLGGELEYVDGGTLVHALSGRRSLR